jgi:hypothetical protein
MTTEAKLLAADNDRDMLEYLHDAFSSQVNVCDNCGHETATSECDSASDLRDYLSNFSTPPQPIYDESKERELFERSVHDKAERFQPDFKRHGLHSDAEYRDANMQWAWELWSIRAKAGEVGHE